MGSKRVGLARTQALIQNLKRELKLNGSQLTGVEQVGMAPEQDGYGVYEAVYETDFGSYTATATDDGLQKTIATLPASARILSCHIICSEVFSDDNVNLSDLVLTATTLTADATVVPTFSILTGIDLGSATAGALGGITGATFAAGTADYVGDGGAGTQLCWINQGVGNGTTAKTSGKIVVYLKWIGSAGSTALTTF